MNELPTKDQVKKRLMSLTVCWLLFIIATIIIDDVSGVAALIKMTPFLACWVGVIIGISMARSTKGWGS